MLADFVIPLPAIISPAPENCVKFKLLVPTISLPGTEFSTHPLKALTVPVSINVKLPVTDEANAKSTVRVGAPDAWTMYIPLSMLDD